MTEMGTHATGSLRLEHSFDAPREAVFDAWINPEVLRRWWAADPDWTCPAAEIDARPGGRYRLSMQTTAGELYIVGGEYLEISPPDRLVYTWCWEGMDENDVTSTVTVSFLDDDGRTRVVLEHTELADPASAARHRHGWTECLLNLERRMFAPAA